MLCSFLFLHRTLLSTFFKNFESGTLQLLELDIFFTLFSFFLKTDIIKVRNINLLVIELLFILRLVQRTVVRSRTHFSDQTVDLLYFRFIKRIDSLVLVTIQNNKLKSFTSDRFYLILFNQTNLE